MRLTCVTIAMTKVRRVEVENNTISEAISLVFFFLFLFLSCNIPVLMDLYELKNLTYAKLLRKCSEVETETSPRKRSFTSLTNIQSQG